MIQLRKVTVKKLSQDFDEIVSYIESTQEAIIITVEEKPDLVLMSINLYEKITGEKIEIIEESGDH